MLIYFLNERSPLILCHYVKMQLLESHIKNELIERSHLVHALPSCDDSKSSLPDPLSFAAIACGASVFEVSMKVPTWAAQVVFSVSPY